MPQFQAAIVRVINLQTKRRGGNNYILEGSGWISVVEITSEVRYLITKEKTFLWLKP